MRNGIYDDRVPVVLNAIVLLLQHVTDEGIKKYNLGTSPVAQWLRIHLPMQGTQDRALVQEDPTCRRAAKPVLHNY